MLSDNEVYVLTIGEGESLKELIMH